MPEVTWVGSARGKSLDCSTPLPCTVYLGSLAVGWSIIEVVARGSSLLDLGGRLWRSDGGMFCVVSEVMSGLIVASTPPTNILACTLMAAFTSLRLELSSESGLSILYLVYTKC